MRTCARCGIVLLVAFVLVVGCTGGVHIQAAETIAPVDARVQTLLDLHLVLGTPDGELHLDRQVTNGEFVVLLERVLQHPQLTLQRLAAPPQAMRRTAGYAHTRGQEVHGAVCWRCAKGSGTSGLGYATGGQRALRGASGAITGCSPPCGMPTSTTGSSTFRSS